MTPDEKRASVNLGLDQFHPIDIGDGIVASGAKRRLS
jgi:hypothetical protein